LNIHNKREGEERMVNKGTEFVIGKEQSTVSWIGRKLAWGEN
jgi:hypothetical protein